LLVSPMSEYRLRTVLCAGNGVSYEPRALAALGFDVTVLDISAVAMQFAENFMMIQKGLIRFFRRPPMRRPGGRVEFVRTALTGQVAWLVRAGSMKPRP